LAGSDKGRGCGVDEGGSAEIGRRPHNMVKSI